MRTCAAVIIDKLETTQTNHDINNRNVTNSSIIPLYKHIIPCYAFFIHLITKHTYLKNIINND